MLGFSFEYAQCPIILPIATDFSGSLALVEDAWTFWAEEGSEVPRQLDRVGSWLSRSDMGHSGTQPVGQPHL